MRLHTKITLLVVIVTLGVGLGSSFMSSRMMHAELESESRKQALLIVQSLAEHVAHSMANNEIEVVHEAATNIVQLSESILYAYVIDFEGQLFAHSFEGDFPNNLTVTHQHAPSAQSPVTVHQQAMGGRVLDVAFPLIAGKRAHVHIGMDEEYMYARVAALRNRILGLTLLLTVVGIAIGIFVSLRITQPLSKMANAMRDFGEGKKNEKLEYGNGKEMVQLAQAFNRMLSDLEKAHEVLAASEERFRAIFEHTKSGVAVYEAVDNGDDFVFLDFNSRGEEIENLSRDEVIGKRLTKVFPSVQEFGMLDVLKRVWETGKAEHHPITMYADERIQGWRENFVYRISSGELAVVYEDITERKQLEAERERSRQFMQTVIDAFPESLMVINRDYSIALANQKACEMAGEKDPVASCLTCHQVSHDSATPCVDDQHPCPLEQVIATRSRVAAEHIHYDAEGKAIPVEIIAAPIFDDKGEVIQIIESSRDVSERERLLAQLHQAQKMESVGRLAGGVAHDFNNMLAVILGNTEIALMQLEPGQPFFDDLEEIRSAAMRSADLTRQLLAFARKQTVEPEVLDLNETVESMLKMLRRLIGEDVDLAWLPGAGVWSVKMDPTQIDQILANLCVNARDAIADVGKITIETDTRAFDHAYCDDNVGFVPGEYVLLAVSDDGCGMDKDTLGKIYEPFFTTKDPGEGTGLGLSTIYGIVKQNNGFINVYSEPGQGTTFRVYLPRYLGKAAQAQKEDVLLPAAQGNEIILVVEDEPALLKITARMLQRQHYTTLAASSPAEAIRLAGQHGGKIHLILTDVVMPGMNGRDLAVELTASYPDMRCLFMSGYTANVIAHHGVLDEGFNFIQKPFSHKDLVIKVRKVLDAAGE